MVHIQTFGYIPSLLFYLGRYFFSTLHIAAYFCLLNDKISRLEVTNSRWKSIKDSFPESKRFRSYPAIKIGRFAVSTAYRGQHIGTELIAMIKVMLNSNQNYSAYRFITVDAYLSAVPFYMKNGFNQLTQKRRG